MGSKNLLPFFFESATLYCNQTKRKRKKVKIEGKEVCDEEKERREYTPKKKRKDFGQHLKATGNYMFWCYRQSFTFWFSTICHYMESRLHLRITRQSKELQEARGLD